MNTPDNQLILEFEACCYRETIEDMHFCMNKTDRYKKFWEMTRLRRERYVEFLEELQDKRLKDTELTK